MRTMLVCCALLAIGCNRKPDVLTADDVATALGMHWWLLEIPEGVEDDHIGLRVVMESGPKSGGGSNGWSKGLVKVMVWEDDGRLHSAMIGNDGHQVHYTPSPDDQPHSGISEADGPQAGQVPPPHVQVRITAVETARSTRGSVETPFERGAVRTSVPNGSVVKLGQLLMAGAPGSVSSLDSGIKAGEVGIMFGR
ncbi:MAG: hypothetical protein ACYTKD_29310 [Planctomycetota bacterium]